MMLARSFSTKASAPKSSNSAPGTIVKLSPPPTQNYLFDFRRLKDKSGWRSQEQTDPDYWVLPREGLGKSYELNWAINGYRITPKGNAFRNLHKNGLLMKSNQKLDSNKAVHVAKTPTTKTYYYVGAKADVKLPASSEVLDQNQYNALLKETRRYLSHANDLFVHDGAMGAVPSTEQKIRVFTDDAVVSLFLRHTVPRAPLNKPIKQFPHTLTAFITPSLQSLGSKSGPFSVIDVESKRVLIGGTSSPSLLRAALADLAGIEVGNQGGLLVPSYSVSLNGKTHLVVGNQELLDKVGDSELVGAHHHILTPTGFARLWDGSSLLLKKNEATKKGDLVEALGNSTYVTRKLAHEQNPPSVSSVFVLNSGDKTSVTKLNTPEATKALVNGFGTQKFLVGDLTQRVSDLLQAHKLDVFLVNLGPKEQSLSNVLKGTK
eukprot:TRINITY_DN5208_c0_g1_i1.p1 TRINITY_DN5208_c0_g1~~TRINITY_DN5208_c0_g1_i1.p1  ORF type:complete len:453 (-),score=112.69 TRINITY_DN5208_c0_g1_i1:146-1444(-)